jgi:hypothetical protein
MLKHCSARGDSMGPNDRSTSEFEHTVDGLFEGERKDDEEEKDEKKEEEEGR